MKTFNKALIGSAAAAALAVSSATPAMARDHRDNDGISAGEVIAGALIIGGIAAIASAGSNRDRYGYRDGYYDRRGYRDGYGPRYNPRQAVSQCVQAAEYRAQRYTRGGYANVTDIRDIDRTRNGLRVKGRIEVQDRYSGYRGYRGRGYSDRGNFTCYVDRGRVRDVRLSGLGR